MKQTLLILFLIQSFFISATVGDKIEKQVLIQVNLKHLHRLI
jgi:hypothetical protein